MEEAGTPWMGWKVGKMVFDRRHGHIRENCEMSWEA